MKDFFIGYNRADRTWAEWIAWQLEAAGYSTVVQAWDFRPGSNFALEMHLATQEADRTIAVLSPDFLKSPFTMPEWAAAFATDPSARKVKLLPVRVRDCDPSGHPAAGYLHRRRRAVRARRSSGTARGCDAQACKAALGSRLSPDTATSNPPHATA